jgi:hypothetical protein
MVRCLKDKRLRVPEGSGDGCCFNAGMRITTMPESKQANRRDYPLALVWQPLTQTGPKWPCPVQVAIANPRFLFAVCGR